MQPETAEFLTLLREQTERLIQMTKTLLEMSNLQQVARNEQIQLAPMVEEIFTDLAPLAEKRSITLEAAVSYTHLDVYKRQGLNRSKFPWQSPVANTIFSSPIF